MELQTDPSFEQRGIMQTIHHPTHGDFKMPAWPVRIDGKPPTLVTSPVLGQHTGEVLQSWLGMSAGEVETLVGDGVVSQ
jgi:crotonobetainyl-CoA:carnitine CoA-transferase CaiB-like acyl-CoA transferase